MKKYLNINTWLIVGTLILVAEIVVIANQLDRPCTLRFKVEKGVNYDDPLPVFESCKPGEHATHFIYDKRLR